MDGLPFKKILVIDDDASVRTLVGKYLARLGYACDTAVDAETALQMTGAECYDLIISDIQMPGMSGMQLLSEIKDRGYPASVIIMTGYADNYSHSEIIERGAADYLSKPFQKDELDARLKRLEKERGMTNQLKSSNESLSQKLQIHTVMADFSKAVISSVPTEQITKLTLQRAQSLTGSRCACLVQVQPVSGGLSVCASLDDGDAVCVAPEDARVCQRCRSLHDQFATDRSPVLCNSMPEAAGPPALTPQGVPVKRCLAVPVVASGALIGIIALANSDRDYTEHDLQVVDLLAENYGLMIQRKRNEEKLAREKDYIEKVLENTADAIGIVDKHGRIIKWNKMACMLYGYELEELRGRKAFDLYADKQQLTDMLAELRRDGFIQRYEIDIRRKDGLVVPIELSVSLLFSDQGEVTGSVSVARDLSLVKKSLVEARLANEELEREIAQRRHAEESMRTSQQIIEGILNAIPVRVFWKDRNLVFLGCNTIFARDAGFSDPKDLVGKDDYQMVWREQAQSYRNDDRHVMQIGYSRLHIEETQTNPDGETMTLLTSKVPLRNSEGEISGVLGTYMDITERKRAEDRLKDQMEFVTRLLETIPSPVFWKDPSGCYLGVNKAFEEFFGKTRDEIIGRTVYDMGSSEIAEKFYKKDQELLQKPGIQTYEWKVKKADESEREVVFYKGTVSDTNDKVAGLIGVILDITESKRAEEDARRAHAEISQLVASIPSILIGLSGEGRIMWWNAAAEETFGLRRETVLGRPFRECRLHWQWEKILDTIDQSRQRHIQQRLDEVRYVRPDGTEGFLGISVSPMGFGEDDRCGLILLARDITSRKHMESQLAQAQKLESIGQLAAGIAHEINTPIQYVGDNTRFLQDAFKDLQQLFDRYAEVPLAIKEGVSADEIFERMQEAAGEADFQYLAEEIPKAIQQTLEGIERVTKIVRAMKEFSHPGTEEKTRIDINRAIESTITVARNEWKYVADLVTDFDSELPLVPCLPSEFNQVILNMIINAVHAISDVVDPGTGEKGIIRIGTRRVSDGVEIRLSDNGSGIPEAIRSKIFDPFFTTKGVGKGTGQGLAISHSVIVDKHGGTIFIDSVVGKGTTFIIWLPISAAAA